MSLRSDDWKEFSDMVIKHLDEYTVPQYGDKDVDEIGKYSVHDCVQVIKKYANRYGTNAREGQQLLDFMKIAHYAQCAWEKEKQIIPKQSFVFNTYADMVDDVQLEKHIRKFGEKEIRITIQEV